MKKQILGCLLLLSIVYLFNSCRDSKDDPSITATGISLDKTTLSMAIGDTLTLSATVNPNNATDKTVTWTSSDASKATVSNGKVTAVAAGTVIITAKVADKTAICTVTVSPSRTNVTGITLDKTTLSMAIGEAQTLTATVSPDNATDKTVTWISSDASKATVSNGKVTAVAAGTVTITAKAGEQTATCTVTVTDYVVINGVKWATRNVDAPGTFVTKPEDAGMFYQWNSKVGWPSTGTVTGWNNSWTGGYTNPSTSDTWTTANDPSPAGYRVPTSTEIQSLFDTTYVTQTWTTQNGVCGEKFTDKTTGNSIFLPASGSRTGPAGTFDFAGSGGFYWSRTAGGLWSSSTSGSGYTFVAGYAYHLLFDSSGALRSLNYPACGYAVRPVVE